jgi:hypothetical protein
VESSQWPANSSFLEISTRARGFLGEAEIDCKVTFNQDPESLRVPWIHKLAYVLGGEFPHSESCMVSGMWMLAYC